MNKPIRNWDARPRKSKRAGHALLTAEQELDLVRAWQDRRDHQARDRLINAFAPMAAAMAKRFSPGDREADPDLVQQANIGLMKAADRFDPDRGLRFSTYAVWWVRAEIQDFKLANLSVVRRPNSAEFRKAYFNLKRLESEISTDAGAAQTDAAVAKALGVSIGRLRDLRLQVSGADSSLNVPSLGDEGEERMALLADPESMGAKEGVEALDIGRLRETLIEAMHALPERERNIVIATQLSDPPATLDTLGNQMGISKERVRQLRERGLERLREKLSRNHLTLDAFV